ncbi:Hint domain-containing protein [Acetobacter fabarum]|uniref:Hint domain-containing protein n=1 Tax=Acetobacter fabarum TaxID=483199 RepID=UPI0014055317|nr:Hint domain-containing protein [Acetobacter fabarum]GBQ34148.1 outer membrane protein [Acetobacter fabarum DSM 19596]
MVHYVNTNGVSCAITDHQGFLGVRDGYHVAMTAPDGTRIYAGVIHPAIFGGQTNGNVLLGTHGSSRAVPAPAGGTYVVPPGVHATFGIGPATGHAPLGSAFYIGGNALLGVALGAPAGLRVYVVGGYAMFAPTEPNATLDGVELNIAYGGVFSCGAGLADVLCGATVRFGAGGGTVVIHADYAPFDLSGTAIMDYNPEQAMIEVRHSAQPVVTCRVSADRHCRSIVLYGQGQEEVGRFTVELAQGAVLDAGEYHVADTRCPLRITAAKGQTRTRACFIEGTDIHTANAPAEVEALQAGSLVDVWSKGGMTTQRLLWVARGHVQVRPDCAEEEAGYPIRVLRHALGQNLPDRDLLLTPQHTVLHNGRFVPVRLLVNGGSIFYDHSITSYNYTLMQTETHAVLVANGVPTEFYLAQEAGQAEAWAGGVVRVGRAAPHVWEKEVLPSPQVERAALAAMFAQLRARGPSVPGCRPFAAVPELSMDPDLFLVTDRGQRIRLLRREGDRCFYMLPVGVKKVFLTSRTTQPSAAHGAYGDGRRTFGVKIGGITLFSGGRHVPQICHLRAEGAAWPGWHVMEANAISRWTTGYAELPLKGVKEGLIGLLTIQVHAAGPFVVPPLAGVGDGRLRA